MKYVNFDELSEREREIYKIAQDKGYEMGVSAFLKLLRDSANEQLKETQLSNRLYSLLKQKFGDKDDEKVSM